jgi:NAD(P) transhydrogenase subunit alpha
MVRSMKPGSVVFDLAAETGGNVEGSRPGETVQEGEVRVVGARAIASSTAPASSVLYARNLFNFVQLLVDAKTKELRIDLNDDLVKGTLLTQDGQLVHEALKAAA